MTTTALRNRPLLGITDAELFVEPPEWHTLIAAIDRGLNVLLVGPPGAGKTSVLRMVSREEHQLPSVYVDLARATTAVEALVLIAEALQVSRPTSLAVNSALRAPAPDAELLDLVRAMGMAKPALLLLDEPPPGEEGHRLFGRLRDELWQLEHQWVVAASPGRAKALQRPPANAFFEVQLDLSALDEPRQRSLLARRLPEISGETLDDLVGRVELPRQLVALARETILAGGSSVTAERRIASANERLAKLSDVERAIVEFLRAHGSTFSSDPALRDALGLSQPRLARILAGLVERGILMRRQEKRGQGRPRTVYELVPEYQL